MTTTIIGLLGPAGAGKSSIAQYLAEVYGAKRYSLAGALKEIARRTLDFSHEQVYGTQEQKEAIDPRYGFSPRTFLQRLGTEGIRSVFGPDVWVNHLLRVIADDMPEIAVIDDVRFENESARLRTDGVDDAFGSSLAATSFVVRVRPPGMRYADLKALVGDYASKHASEREWLTAEADLEIAPEKPGLRELHMLVDDVMDALGFKTFEQQVRG